MKSHGLGVSWNFSYWYTEIHLYEVSYRDNNLRYFEILKTKWQCFSRFYERFMNWKNGQRHSSGTGYPNTNYTGKNFS